MSENSEKMTWDNEWIKFPLRKRFPLVLQSEASECGLACLCMIMGWFGRSSDMLHLREEYGVSSRGATLADIITVADHNSLSTRPLSLDLEDLSQIRLPCIMHWDFSHFVVLVRVTRKGFIIHDPASGVRTVNLRELSEHFTGIALEVWPDLEFKPQKQRKLLQLSTLARNISGLRTSLSVIFCLSLVTEFISLLLPVGTQMVMDHAVPANDHGLLMLVCLSLLLLTLLQAGISIMRNRTSLVMNTLTEMQWKDGLFKHLLRLPLSWFEKRFVGDIQSRFGSLDAVRTIFTHNITQALTDAIMSIGALILLILYGGWLSSIVICVTLIYVLMRLTTYPVYRRTSEELLVKNARASSLFTETLFAISTIRAQGLEEQRRKNWLNQIAGSVTTSFRLARFDMLFAVLSAFITASDNVLILWLGISLVMDHKMTVGAFIAFGAFRGMFSDRILSLTGMFLQLRMLSVHSDRIADIALSNPEEIGGKKVVIPTSGQEPLSLETRNLAFSYFSGSKPVFSGLDITINAGESVAITGPSGCGKSTLMKVLCGLSAATEGCVLASGIEINEFGIQNYRKQVSCILQEDRLLAGSIKDNITGFCEKPDEEWMICCARAAYIHDDIAFLPMGYETLTGELGEGLSGGQRQRIFIARALYAKPRILFMDEATSHLDETNERLINEAISELNITRIIIAHRVTTIASANRVISMI